MTAIIAWSTFDGHDGPASLYLASDSRISREISNNNWETVSDTHKKIFASPETPDLFGFCGPISGMDELFPLLCSCAAHIRKSKGYGPGSEAQYSTDIFNAATDRGSHSLSAGVQIFHGYRFDTRRFGLSQVSMSKDGKFHRIDYKLPEKGGLLFREGLGDEMVQKTQEEYFDAEVESKGFSRWFWMSFYESLQNSSHPTCGGAPQLAALYTKSSAVTLGVFFKGAGYVCGQPCMLDDREYRDALFQRVDARGALLPKAQPHARMGQARLFQFAR